MSALSGVSTDGRIGDWCQVWSGRRFWPLDPRPEDLDIDDIAHGLSNFCRYGGHVREFYSVAEHSVRVSRVLGPPHRLWGLLHDASEAYLYDLPRPVKLLPELAPYREAEKRLMAVICARYGLPLEEPPEVKIADNRMLFTERRDLLRQVPWAYELEPYPEIIEPWSPREAKRAFLEEFEQIMRAA